MKEFNEIVERILGIEISLIRDAMSPKDVPNWDSMNYLLFISELEKAFHVSFTMDEVLGAKNLGDIKQSMRSKGIMV